MGKEEFQEKFQNQAFPVLNKLVYDYIVEGITELRFEPGSRVNTVKIAQDLSISRTPIRMALDQLTEEGLVERNGEKGFNVKKVDWADYRHLSVARRALESNAAAIAADNISTLELQQMKEIISQLKALEPNDFHSFVALDAQFHELIIKATRNSYIVAMYQRLKIWIRHYQYILMFYEKNNFCGDPYLLEQYLVICRAMQSRFSSVARAEMERHLQYMYDTTGHSARYEGRPGAIARKSREGFLKKEPLLPAQAREPSDARCEPVYRSLLDEIISLRLAPGERINISKTAEKLGVSRTPVRAALSQLEEDELVDSVSKGGYRVRPIYLSDCLNLCDARKILEGGAAALAAADITPEELEELKGFILASMRCNEKKDYPGFAREDAHFHSCIVRATRNRYIIEMYDSLDTRIFRYRNALEQYRSDMILPDTGNAMEKHQSIYRALKNRYASVAQEEMGAHIMYTFRTLFELCQPVK